MSDTQRILMGALKFHAPPLLLVETLMSDTQKILMEALKFHGHRFY